MINNKMFQALEIYSYVIDKSFETYPAFINNNFVSKIKIFKHNTLYSCIHNTYRSLFCVKAFIDIDVLRSWGIS